MYNYFIDTTYEHCSKFVLLTNLYNPYVENIITIPVSFIYLQNTAMHFKIFNGWLKPVYMGYTLYTCEIFIHRNVHDICIKFYN